jgi:hypothetical protein
MRPCGPLTALLVWLAVSGSASARTLVLPRESVWRYEDSGVALPANWIDTSFDDAAWDSGPGPLGYGEPFINTTVDFGGNPNDKHITTYFRTTFDLQDDPQNVQSFAMRANYDDGIVVYLNGQEVSRLSMPAGPITFNTLASLHEGGGYELIDLGDAIPWLGQTGNVIAVEAHQASPTSSDLVMDLELETSLAPALVTVGPFLQIGTPDGVTIRWRTNVPVDTRVDLGPSPGSLTLAYEELVDRLNHIVPLSGLDPDTRYYYSFGASTFPLGGDDTDHFFMTPPPTGSTRSIRIWVIGDSGQPGSDQQNVKNAYLAHPGADATDFWMMLGDNAYDSGTEAEYQAAVWDAYPELLNKYPLWPTRGNHDVVRVGGNNDYLNFFTLPMNGEAGGVASGSESYYSFDFANIHFVCLDSEGSDRSPTGAMLLWLVADLAATTADWTIAYWHHPPYTKGSHDSDNAGDSGGRMRDMRENVLPILESHGVDLVLSGHSHSYERSFLLDGHYDVSSTLEPSMILDGGNGRIGGDGAYEKPTTGATPNEGAVYITAGSSSKISGGPLNHPVMITSLNELGSVVLDVAGDRLDASFIDDAGATDDFFTIRKGSPSDSPIERSLSLSVGAHPNPFTAETQVSFGLPAAGAAQVRIVDIAGRTVRTLLDGQRPEGVHHARWDGRDADGRPAAPGVYVAILEYGGTRRAVKITRTR